MGKEAGAKTLRTRRTLVVVITALFLFFVQAFGFSDNTPIQDPQPTNSDVLSESNHSRVMAVDELEKLLVKGRAPKTDYSRSQFGDGWARVGDCDVRNLILQRDLLSVWLDNDGCVVRSGLLLDPYTAQQITFNRGSETSDDVQVDHVVSLSDAWQKGAQQISFDTRLQFANDSLNLLAVDGEANQQKSNSDAASWLPPNKNYRCPFIARQIAVKRKYSLWVTDAEKSAMQRVLSSCKDQPLPIVNE